MIYVYYIFEVGIFFFRNSIIRMTGLSAFPNALPFELNGLSSNFLSQIKKPFYRKRRVSKKSFIILLEPQLLSASVYGSSDKRCLDLRRKNISFSFHMICERRAVDSVILSLHVHNCGIKIKMNSDEAISVFGYHVWSSATEDYRIWDLGGDDSRKQTLFTQRERSE